MGQLKRYNLHLKGMPEWEDGTNGTEEMFEAITSENFTKLMTGIKPQI